MRAVEPAETGVATSPDGVRIAYEVFGAGDPAIVFLPSTPIVHSRQWKGQVPYFSRRHRVIAFDGRGNGRSDRPTEPDDYREEHLLGDIEAVMDATGTQAAVLVGLCSDGVWRAIQHWRRTHSPGICAQCGYDLRATPFRCPECGFVPLPVFRERIG